MAEHPGGNCCDGDRGGKNNKKGGYENPFAGQDLFQLLSLSGGALGGAAVLFGIKKIYDYWNSGPVLSGSASVTHVHTPVTPSRELFNTPVTPSRELFKSFPDVVPESAIPSIEVTCDEEKPLIKNESKPSSGTATPLSEESLPSSNHDNQVNLYKQLVVFHSDVCSIPEAVIAEAQDVRDELLFYFEKYISQLLPTIRVNRLHSAAFDPQVGVIHTVEIRIPLNLNSDIWKFVDAGESVLAAHGHCYVKRCNREFFSLGSSPFDKFLVADNLSPSRLRDIFHDMTHRVAKWGSNLEVKAAVVSAHAQLMVLRPQQPVLHVNFVPEITIGRQTVVAKSHPIKDVSHENLWQTCYGRECMQTMQTTSDCQMVCLQLLLGLQQTQPALADLSRPVVMATVLHLMASEDDWSEEALAERFLDALRFLQEACMSGSMAHPLNPAWNLLKYSRPETLGAAAGLIHEVLENKSYDWLLMTHQQSNGVN